MLILLIRDVAVGQQMHNLYISSASEPNLQDLFCVSSGTGKKQERQLMRGLMLQDMQSELHGLSSKLERHSIQKVS